MENKKLLENMGRLGYPLVEVLAGIDVYDTLAQVVNSGEGRYWEGFPIILANVAKEQAFDYEKVADRLEGSNTEKCKELFLLALALYDVNKLKFSWVKDLFSRLGVVERDKVRSYKEALIRNDELMIGQKVLSSERLKNSFRNYFSMVTAEARSLGDRHTELSLEFAFSQIFSLRQRELFNKRLKGEMMTKTEKEYFSRVVRKKAAALANRELHQLAQKVIEM